MAQFRTGARAQVHYLPKCDVRISYDGMDWNTTFVRNSATRYSLIASNLEHSVSHC
jgi:hypothetical protein